MMKRNESSHQRMGNSAVPFGLIHLGALLLAVSCANQTEVKKTENAGVIGFTEAKPILERNCVHCHDSSRLPGMPSMSDTEALSALIGPNKLIIPGKPEQSRFLTVVTLSDDQAGAMPPTGHAITENEAETLSKWILAGAPLPSANTKLHSQGESPRSR